MASTTFSVGDTVIIHSTSRAELNDRVGTIIALDPNSNRYTVKSLKSNQTKFTHRFLIKNMKRYVPTATGKHKTTGVRVINIAAHLEMFYHYVRTHVDVRAELSRRAIEGYQEKGCGAIHVNAYDVQTGAFLSKVKQLIRPRQCKWMSDAELSTQFGKAYTRNGGTSRLRNCVRYTASAALFLQNKNIRQRLQHGLWKDPHNINRMDNQAFGNGLDPNHHGKHLRPVLEWLSVDDQNDCTPMPPDVKKIYKKHPIDFQTAVILMQDRFKNGGLFFWEISRTMTDHCGRRIDGNGGERADGKLPLLAGPRDPLELMATTVCRAKGLGGSNPQQNYDEAMLLTQHTRLTIYNRAMSSMFSQHQLGNESAFQTPRSDQLKLEKAMTKTKRNKKQRLGCADQRRNVPARVQVWPDKVMDDNAMDYFNSFMLLGFTVRSEDENRFRQSNGGQKISKGQKRELDQTYEGQAAKDEYTGTLGLCPPWMYRMHNSGLHIAGKHLELSNLNFGVIAGTLLEEEMNDPELKDSAVAHMTSESSGNLTTHLQKHGNENQYRELIFCGNRHCQWAGVSLVDMMQQLIERKKRVQEMLMLGEDKLNFKKCSRCECLVEKGTFLLHCV